MTTIPLIACCMFVASACPLATTAGPRGAATDPLAAQQDSPADPFLAPVRLRADGAIIDQGATGHGHAGPWLEDLDGDGRRDLIVGDFPGYFWLYQNVGSETAPRYSARGKLQAGGENAVVPVY